MATDKKIIDLQTKRARTDDAPELPPADAYADDIAAEITDTDIANGARLAERHGENLRFTIERGWYVWGGRRWQCDEKMVALQGLAKETARSIFDEIKASPDPKAMFVHARRSQ